jgi:hypothetical protein
VPSYSKKFQWFKGYGADTKVLQKDGLPDKGHFYNPLPALRKGFKKQQNLMLFKMIFNHTYRNVL